MSAIEQIDELIRQKQQEIAHLEAAKAIMQGECLAPSPGILITPDKASSKKPKANKADRLAKIAKSAKKTRRKFSNAQKLAILEEIEAAPSIQAVLDKHKLSASPIYKWKRLKKEGKL